MRAAARNTDQALRRRRTHMPIPAATPLAGCAALDFRAALWAI